MSSFTELASVTATTKRSPGTVDGLRQEPVTYIASLSCLPLDPVDPEVRERPGLAAFQELLQTYVTGGLDIREGDILVVSSVEYPIRAVEDWHWPPEDADYQRLIVEDVK